MYIKPRQVAVLLFVAIAWYLRRLSVDKKFSLAESLPMWVKPSLLDLNFTWIIRSENICKTKQNDQRNQYIMPILVHTARSHFADRHVLRKTLGSFPIYKNWDVRIVFLLGQADFEHSSRNQKKQHDQENKQIAAEQNKYGDLVIGSFEDSYHNLTYKHLMGYKWILSFCSSAKFVMKIDDDMFIDLIKLIDWLSTEINMTNHSKMPDLYCQLFSGRHPVRQIGNKWYASLKEWPQPDYPEYCSGWAYAISVDLIQKIYLVSNNHKMFWVDDVFVTGSLLTAAKQQFRFMPEIRNISHEFTTDIFEYRPLCTKLDFSIQRVFKAVVNVPRGRFFERDITCMLNKTLFDQKLL